MRGYSVTGFNEKIQRKDSVKILSHSWFKLSEKKAVSKTLKHNVETLKTSLESVKKFSYLSN